ncbi:receptor protein-tyrosine kinase [Natronocella acetinitrilica]|uniref:non-specific protein-tyrosine kinase n=1 Tax=Natronocella acetinitrilica TaxID=414046 RepID=A0AAE3KI86_9GAMM|nr:AAA family ATPase [Natronocella acetinitrilica]MCP1677137.1 receptor protein-tyrosine kinase [Natronocella acetinitrilica]
MSVIEKAINRLRESGDGTTGRKDKPAETRHPEPPREPEPAVEAASVGAVPAPVADREPVRVDYARLRAQGIYPPIDAERAIKDQYRRIKRPLIAGAIGKGTAAIPNGNLIMVTSAQPGEGKTFTSINLALSIAQDPDFSVTLVDGDVSRAHTSKIFGIRDEPGLLDLLADESLSASEVILPTTVDSLTVLPAGRAHSLSEELLSSARMERVVSALADRSTRHIILFDSPPLLVSAEAITLSANVGQILVVVKSAATPRHYVVAAVELLDPNKAVSLVLNQSLGGLGGDDYGSYYGESTPG